MLHILIWNCYKIVNQITTTKTSICILTIFRKASVATKLLKRMNQQPVRILLSVTSSKSDRGGHCPPEMITEPECRSGLLSEWTLAGVGILGRSRSRIRSQYFRFGLEQESESTLRSVRESINISKGPIKISGMMLVVVKQNGINWD